MFKRKYFLERSMSYCELKRKADKQGEWQAAARERGVQTDRDRDRKWERNR